LQWAVRGDQKRKYDYSVGAVGLSFAVQGLSNVLRFENLAVSRCWWSITQNMPLKGIGKGTQMIRMLNERTVEVSLPNKLGYERIAMECSASFAKIVGFVPERIQDLKTAVAEACLNAMEHGNKCHPDKRVIVTMNYEADVFSVTVVDEGEGLEELPGEPDIEEKILNLQTPRGLGIFLIKQLVDQVEFNKMSNEGHMVRMEIKLTK
jgi:serine/threonine-protein kinase RsbW